MNFYKNSRPIPRNSSFCCKEFLLNCSAILTNPVKSLCASSSPSRASKKLHPSAWLLPAILRILRNSHPSRISGCVKHYFVLYIAYCPLSSDCNRISSNEIILRSSLSQCLPGIIRVDYLYTA